MRWDLVPALLLALVVIVGSARLLGMLAGRLGQPAVIGEIVGGILLGPTLLGGAVGHALVAPEIRPSLSLLANVGVGVFMFLVGLDVEPGVLRGQGRITAGVSLSAVVLPFGLGALLALYLVDDQADRSPAHRLAFVLFLGTAMAVTAFPVLARILTDKGLLHTPIGGLALACASIDDVLAWSLLAVVAALAGGAAPPWQALLVIPFGAVLFLLVKPLLARLARHVGGWQRNRPAAGRVVRAGLVVAVAAALWACAAATDAMGLHLIFGAFLLGVVMPRGAEDGAEEDGAEDGTATAVGLLPARVLTVVRRVCSVLLLPIFFMAAGLNVDLSSLDGLAVGELALILAAAIGGKALGAFLGAWWGGVRVRHSAVLAILMNTRGLTELIVLTVGLQLHVLDTRLYSLMVVMALVTTAMAGVLLPFVYPRDRVEADLSGVRTPERSAS